MPDLAIIPDDSPKTCATSGTSGVRLALGLADLPDTRTVEVHTLGKERKPWHRETLTAASAARLSPACTIFSRREFRSLTKRKLCHNEISR
jgi:hypothetical protein